MPVTYRRIASAEITGATAANIEFTNIPSGYTDLIVKFSARTNRATVGSDIYAEFNGNTSAVYSFRRAYGDGGGANSDSLTDNAKGCFVGWATATNATTSTFGNAEFYITNYTNSSNKFISGDSVSENNGSTSYQQIVASSWSPSPSAAITSIKLLDYNGASFVTNSTATLYGVKKD